MIDDDLMERGKSCKVPGGFFFSFCFFPPLCASFFFFAPIKIGGKNRGGTCVAAGEKWSKEVNGLSRRK